MGSPGGGGGYSPGIDNLQAFVARLRTTLQGVGDHQAELETLSGSLQELDGTADNVLEKVIDTLDAQKAEIEQSQKETEGHIQAMTHTAEEVAGRLAEIDQTIEKDEEAFTAEVAEEKADLEKDYAELTHDGFEALHDVLSTIEGNLEGATQTLTQEFATLDAAIAAMDSEVDTAGSEGVAAIDAAGEALRQAEQDFAAAATAATEVWATELPADVEQECKDEVGPIEQAYEAFHGVAEQKGDELLKAVETESELLMEDVDQLSQSLDDEAQATEGALENDLENELHETAKTAEAGAGDISSMSESMFPDLEFALKVADHVGSLLKAMSGE